MSREAIKTISEAEEKAKRLKQDAAAEAKKSIDSAEAEGKKSLDFASEKAKAELEQLTTQAENKAREEAIELAKSIENRKAAMRAKAESKLDTAAALVVERIVGG